MAQDARARTVTMLDVARRAGVSRALVSIVFRDAPGASDATRERVRAAAAELGYRPDQRARLLGRHRTRTVGVVFGLHREFHGQVVEDLYRAAEGSGYELALGASAPSRGEAQAARALLDYRCEALVLLGPTLSVAALEDLAAAVPVVVVARAVRSSAVDVVRTDDVAGARMATDHLLDLGHTAVAHVDGGRAPGAAERRRGYRAALAARGLSAGARVVPGGLDEASGEVAAAALLDGRPTVTAVTAFNDHCATGLLFAARARGSSVPGHLSLVGYDDSAVARLGSVQLTTVAQDSPALATAALGLALRRLEDGPSTPNGDGVRDRGRGGDSGGRREVVVPPRLVVRGTTAPPR
ncbi:LacI family DNA-binding transcriptional regulator [Nocardioides sp. HDW12B]|uniref:LacI family DNA-binding transcriptional regulator n=1 Tax=Nocardioides sp. HDW12B TaxID=2714939 RepID=UPI001F0F48E3|nr:LacI family DNA-binding transcriptional regulator [Nocardioides sp. HDW12B]